MAENSNLDAFAAKYGLSSSKPAVPTAQSIQKPEDPTKAFGKFLADRTSNSALSLQDGNEYGRVNTFDNSVTGAFKDRYKAYGQDTYNRIGFDPYINNELNFTSKTNTYDDLKRWATASALPMVGLGFMSPLNSYKDIATGNTFKGDTDMAKDYEYYNALGYSSRGGIGGFGVNLLNSFSYSAGILIEGAIEGALIGAAVGAVAGEGIGAAPGAAIGGLVEGISALTKVPRALFQTAKTIGNIGKTVKGLTAVNSAKNVWNAVKTGGTTVGKILNPLENTTEAVMNLSKWKDIDNMTGLARSAKTAGAFWHDMMSMNMALSEGKLEGGFSELKRYEKLYNDHYAKFGEAPDEETQRKMVQNAREAGITNTMWNTGLVFYSNKIALPSLTRAKFLKGIPRLNAGKVVGAVGKEFQLVVNNADDIAKASMEKVPISFKNSLKALKSPRKLGAVGLNYLKANLVEGLQEVGQDALSEAVENYYDKIYKEPSVRSNRMFASALVDGIGKQSVFSETFLSGFAMGTLFQGPSTLVKHGTRLGNRIFKSKDSYDQYVKEKSEDADRIVNAFNNMTGENAKYLFDPSINSLANLSLLAKRVDNPDDATTKEIKDDGAAVFALSMLSSIKNGTFDMYMDHIKNYKNATPEEIEEAWELEKGEGQKALDNLDQAINNAKTIKNRYEFAGKRFKPAIVKEKFKEGTEEHLIAELYEQGYKESLTSFVFLQDSVDNTIQRLDKLYNTAAKLEVIAASPFSNFAVLTNNANKLDREIEMLKADIEIGSQSTEPTTREEVDQKRKLLKNLFKFQEAQNKVTMSLALAKEAGEKSEDFFNALKEEGQDIHAEYSQAFLNVLNTIAGSTENQLKLQDQIEKNGGFEQLYDALFDTHLLKDDRNILSDYINLLAEPEEFYEHVNRNFKFMKNLYDNRKEYIKDVVNQEFEIAENNEVLTELATQGIFVDLDKFADWVENKQNIPDEFIDTTNNMIINTSSVLYPKYAAIFARAASASLRKAAGDPATEKQKLDNRLEEINNKKKEEINKLRENYEQQFLQEVGRELDAIEQENSRINQDNVQLEKDKEAAQKDIDLLTKALETLGGKDIVKINKAIDDLLDNNIISQEEYERLTALDANDPAVINEFKGILGVVYNKDLSNEENYRAAGLIMVMPDFIANEINNKKEILATAPAEPTDIESTTAYKVYTEAVEQVNGRYEKLTEEVKEAFAEKGIDENTVDPISVNTSYDEMPEELQAQIDAEFDKFLAESGDDASLKTVNPNAYEMQRENWIALNGRELISAYNQRVADEARARAEKLKEPPFLKYNKKQVDPKTDTVFSLNQLYKQLSKLSESGKDLKGKDLTAQQKADLKEDLENLAGYLDAIAKSYKPKSIAQKTVDKIVERVVNRRGEVEDVIDEKGRKTRKFAGEETTTDIERKSGESIEDFINRLFENNYFVEVDGKQLFSLTQGRWGVVVNVGGIKVPFYQSTSGTDTKVVGQWYPFFGDQGNWVIKGNSDDSNVGYGFKAIQDVQSFLNKNIKETDAIALSNLVPTEVNQNKEDLRKLNESQIKANDNLSISKEATAKRLSELMGYTVEEANKTKSDSELFALASKKVFAELAALKGTTTTDIEVKKAERRKRYYNGPANRMVQVQKDSENTPVTQEQIEEIEQVIEKAKELGWDKNRLFRQLSSMGYSYAFGVNSEGYRNYLEDRLSGKTNIKVTSEFNFFEQLDAELAALEEGTTNTGKLRRVTEISSKIAKEKTNFDWAYNKKELILNKFKEILENETDTNKAVSTFMGLFTRLSKTGATKQFDSKRKLEAIEKALKETPTLEKLSTLIDDYAFIESTEAGTKVDELIRKFLTLDSDSGFLQIDYNGTIDINGTEYKVSDFMSKKAFDRMFGAGGIVSSIRSKMIDGEFVLFPENLVVFDKTLGITGEIDLLGVNAKGEVMIIDIKTSKNWDNYEKENNYQQLSHRAQLSIYSTLFYNMTGIKPKELKILPLQISVDVEGYVNDIDKAKVTILDKDGNPVKEANGKTNKKRLLAPGYYDLEFLDEIADEGVIMIEPTFTDDISEDDYVEQGTEETLPTEGVLEETEELDGLTLNDLVNKQVIFNGTSGKLIVLEDGSYAVEKRNTKDTALYEQLLKELNRDLDEETNPEIRDLIKKSIDDTEANIEESKKDKVIEVVYHKLKPATNGSLTPSELGISVITGITFPFQVNNINGRAIKAEFTNNSETTAKINGVDYNVIRDNSGAIVALSYRKNQALINEIDEEISYARTELTRLSKQPYQVFMLNQLADLNARIDKLTKEQEELLANNDLVFVKGGNSNDYIFALNSLPNSFQKATKALKPADEKKDLKEIDRLSLSASISTAITEILDTEEYPETLDILFDVGVQGITLSELDYIYNWIDKKVDELYALSSTVINRGDLVDDISNQINALLQLKNDLNLIKIIKDGKTKKPRFSKQQAAANKIFGTKEVQKRTSVPKNEKPTSRQTKTVSGQPAGEISTDELKDIVKAAKSVKPNFSSTKTKTETEENQDLFSEINSAKSKEELETAYINTLNKRGDVSATTVTEVYNKRKEELNKVSSDTLKKGTLLYAKNPIFDGVENAVVEVVMLNPSSKQVVVKLFGTETKKAFSEQEIKDNFIMYNKEAMEKSNVVEPVTETQKAKSTISKSSIKDLGTNPELLNKAKEDAKKDSKSRFSALKAASDKNNINNCD